MRHSAMRYLAFVGVSLFSSALIFGGSRHAVAEHWAGSSDPRLWLRAAELEQSNADNWYRLGRYRQLDFENADLPQAISYYRRATELDPGSASYWLDLAAAYDTLGDNIHAEQAYVQARHDYPISAKVAWEYGSFLLRRNRIEEGFNQIHDALSVDPRMTELAVSRCWRSTQDIDRILQLALPPGSDTYWGAIRYFVNVPEPDAAMAVWKRLIAQRTFLPSPKAFPLIDMLIAAHHAADAWTVWQQTLSASKTTPDTSPKGSLIWDGGFEREWLNGGFAWRYQPVAGASMDLDEEAAHSGQRSLRVVFDGTTNVNFAGIWQYVAVQPDTQYRFSAYIRVEDLSTDSGIRFEIDDAETGALLKMTSNVVGTQPWALDETDFSTGPHTVLLRIVLRRVLSNMLGNKISGTVWVDDIALVPISSASAP